MKIISGIECVRIIGRDRGLSDNIDNLLTTQHDKRYKEDFMLAKQMGIDTLRIGVPWNRIEEVKGVYNWEWFDGYMQSLKEAGIEAILDPLHHVTIPSWLVDGFLDFNFSSSYIVFFYHLIKRYPYVNKYTIVNEPLVTTYFSTEAGIWFPFETGKFREGVVNIMEVFKECSFMLQYAKKEHWYIDAAEYHYGICNTSNKHAEEKNIWRFKMLDLLISQGVSIDMLGLDYYAHCEFEWSKDGRLQTNKPIGFANIVKQYRERYNLPITLTETNIRGFIEDRITWLKYMYKECQKAGIETMCWYPLIDSTDWDSLVTQPNYNIDPVGLIWLDKDFTRHTSELTDSVKYLNNGSSVDDLSSYNLQPPLDVQLRGFVCQ